MGGGGRGDKYIQCSVLFTRIVEQQRKRIGLDASDCVIIIVIITMRDFQSAYSSEAQGAAQ